MHKGATEFEEAKDGYFHVHNTNAVKQITLKEELQGFGGAVWERALNEPLID